MMHGRLKKIIFDKLYKDLSKLEIIDYRDSIWFIDRENKYWYLEYDKDGRLYWRYDFFPNFFSLFSFEREEFEPILAEWVEEILNHKVGTIFPCPWLQQSWVQDVLNCKVDSIIGSRPWWVQDVLNCKVNTIYHGLWHQAMAVENVLNCKINKTISLNHPDYPNVENALNLKVSEIQQRSVYAPGTVEDILNL
jgi:hypothetical protein